MSYVPHYKKSDWSALCDRCGHKFHASQLRKTWDGLYVCKDDYEVRHPSDFQRGKKDDPSVEWTRPEGTDVEVDNSGWLAQDTVPTGTF